MTSEGSCRLSVWIWGPSSPPGCEAGGGCSPPPSPAAGGGGGVAGGAPSSSPWARHGCHPRLNCCLECSLRGSGSTARDAVAIGLVTGWRAAAHACILFDRVSLQGDQCAAPTGCGIVDLQKVEKMSWRFSRTTALDGGRCLKFRCRKPCIAARSGYSARRCHPRNSVNSRHLQCRAAVQPLALPRRARTLTRAPGGCAAPA